MSFLEKKISENKPFFDDRPLPDGHFGRFLKRLDAEAETDEKGRSFSIFNMLKIAAVVILLVSIGWFTMRYSMREISGAVLNEVVSIELSKELLDIFAYYDARSESQLSQIQNLAPNDEEAQKIKDMALKKLQNIDAEMAAIEKEYMANPGNKKLEAALVNLKRNKAEVMETIVNQLNANSRLTNNTSVTN